MALFGKSFSDYFRFQKVFLILTVTFGLLRVILSMAGLPDGLVTWISMTYLAMVAIVYYPIRMRHTTGFRGFGQLLVLLGLLILVGQVMTAVGIYAAGWTGVDNIYSTANANHRAHAIGHMTTWLPRTLIASVLASVILLVARLISKSPTVAGS